MTEIEGTKFYTTGQLARMYGRDERTIQRWAISKKVRSIKIGKYYYFPKEDHDRISNR